MSRSTSRENYNPDELDRTIEAVLAAAAKVTTVPDGYNDPNWNTGNPNNNNNNFNQQQQNYPPYHPQQQQQTPYNNNGNNQNRGGPFSPQNNHQQYPNNNNNNQYPLQQNFYYYQAPSSNQQQNQQPHRADQFSQVTPRSELTSARGASTRNNNNKNQNAVNNNVGPYNDDVDATTDAILGSLSSNRGSQPMSSRQQHNNNNNLDNNKLDGTRNSGWQQQPNDNNEMLSSPNPNNSARNNQNQNQNQQQPTAAELIRQRREAANAANNNNNNNNQSTKKSNTNNGKSKSPSSPVSRRGESEKKTERRRTIWDDMEDANNNDDERQPRTREENEALRASNEFVIRRMELWQYQKIKERQDFERDRAQDEMRGCTFQPDLDEARRRAVNLVGAANEEEELQRLLAPSPLYYDNRAWGYDNFVRRLEVARERKVDKEIQDAEAFRVKGPAAARFRQGNHRATVPDPFEFSSGQGHASKRLEHHLMTSGRTNVGGSPGGPSLIALRRGQPLLPHQGIRATEVERIAEDRSRIRQETGATVPSGAFSQHGAWKDIANPL